MHSYTLQSLEERCCWTPRFHWMWIPLEVLLYFPCIFYFLNSLTASLADSPRSLANFPGTHTLQKEQVLSSFSDRSIDPLIYRLQHGGFQWVQPLLTCCWLQPQWLSILLSPWSFIVESLVGVAACINQGVSVISRRNLAVHLTLFSLLLKQQVILWLSDAYLNRCTWLSLHQDVSHLQLQIKSAVLTLANPSVKLWQCWNCWTPILYCKHLSSFQNLHVPFRSLLLELPSVIRWLVGDNDILRGKHS